MYGMTDSFNDATTLWKTAERNTTRTAIVVLFFLFAFVGIILYANQRHAHSDTVRFINDSTIAMLALYVAISLYLVARWQVRMAYLQIAQAEELAQRKDAALITAIEALTNELKRRPAPNPAVINFSLFGRR
jgi:NhaP-type Na+/H+ or K+/H+ antiporter